MKKGRGKLPGPFFVSPTIGGWGWEMFQRLERRELGFCKLLRSGLLRLRIGWHWKLLFRGLT